MTQRASTPSGPGKVAGPAGRVLALAWPEARGDGAAARARGLMGAARGHGDEQEHSCQAQPVRQFVTSLPPAANLRPAAALATIAAG